MGVNQWYIVFGGNATVRTEKDFKGKRLGVDVSYEIYRGSLGMKNIKSLTDKKGTPTVLLNTLLCNVVRYKKLGVTGLVYVFDNPTPNPHKAGEAKKRKAKREKIKKKKAITEDDEYKREKQLFSITATMITDVKKLLTSLGVAWIVAPVNFEAEHLGAALMQNDVIDTFITSDSDTLMFGGKSLTRKIKKKGTKKYVYEEYLLGDILNNHHLTMREFIHLGVVLGCDFAEKTKGIGPKTIFKKGPHTILTADQQKAFEYFLTPCPYKNDMIQKQKKDIPAVVAWLTADKNFNKKRVERLLSVFM